MFRIIRKVESKASRKVLDITAIQCFNSDEDAVDLLVKWTREFPLEMVSMVWVD